jgi:hypothetical protein
MLNVLTKIRSLSIHCLDFLMTLSSQRRVEESSIRLKDECFHGWHHPSPKDEGGKLLYLSSKN